MNLQDIQQDDLNLVGSKAYSLSKMYNELKNKNVEVPDGFVVTTQSFNDFISFNNINKLIENEMSIINSNIDDFHIVELSAKKIQQKILSGNFDELLNNNILNSFLNLKSDIVAVRSSSTAEDLNNASFAGQYDSMLNVTSNNLLESIKAVFASLYNVRAILYRHSINMTSDNLEMAVLIQSMIQNEDGSAGVAFGIDIDDDNPDIFYISSTYGMGEMIVNGMVISDEIKINKSDLSILESTIGQKSEKMIKSNIIVEVEESKQEVLSLSVDNINQLSKTLLIIENFYNKPMDVEWVIDNDDRLYILQARPITTL
jgi:pyruvate,water dikinase